MKNFGHLKIFSSALNLGKRLESLDLTVQAKQRFLEFWQDNYFPIREKCKSLGKSAAMIDLTAGFQMNATGERNIFLRSALLGRSEKETRAEFDSIVEFSELGDAISANLSTYSSGMLMRLAFSIMISIEPDLLLVDEVLSVGDFRFRQKCLARIRELRKQCGFVLVSHSMHDIKNFCDSAILLDKGRLIAEGPPAQVIEIYENMEPLSVQSPEEKISSALFPQFKNDDVITISEPHWCNADLEPITEIVSGERLYFNFRFKINYSPKRLIVGVPIFSEDGTAVSGLSSEIGGEKIKIEPNTEYKFLFEVPALFLNPGEYISNLGIVDGTEFLFRVENPSIKVLPNGQRNWGFVPLEHNWRVYQD